MGIEGVEEILVEIEGKDKEGLESLPDEELEVSTSTIKVSHVTSPTLKVG